MIWAGTVSQPAGDASAQAAAADGEAEEDDELDIQLEEPDALAQDGSEVLLPRSSSVAQS